MNFSEKQALLKIFSAHDDKILFARIIETAEKSVLRYTPAFSDFVDPYRANIAFNALQSVSKEAGYVIKAYGGMFICERVVMGFCPLFLDDNMELDDERFPITRIKVTYEKKFTKILTHRDFLGAMTGLSIDRGKIGDIIIQDGYSYILVKNEIVDYVLKNFFAVGSVSVSCETTDYMEINAAISEPRQMSTTVASARLDGVVAHCFHISRGDAAEAIRREKIYINWLVTQNSSKEIQEGDMISFRGVGRIKITGLSSQSKKGRYFVEYFAYF